MKNVCERKRRELAETDAQFEDEVLSPIMDVRISSEWTDTALAAFAVAYSDRHDMVAIFDEGYSAVAVNYCCRRMSEVYLALMKKERATNDVCRKASYLAVMAELGKVKPNRDLGLTHRQLSYPFDRMKEWVIASGSLQPEVEALLMQTETAEMFGTEADEWRRMTAVADRWTVGYALDQWRDLNVTTALSRAVVLTTLSINMEHDHERPSKYKAVAEAIVKTVADEVLTAGGDATSLVQLYHVAERLYAESDGLFTGESPWRDTMRSVAAALSTAMPDGLPARAIAVAEAAWIAKTARLAEYR